MSPRTLVWLVIVVALTLSGCGGTEAPTPPSRTSTIPTSSSTPPPSVPPPVNSPVDLTPYARHPCTALTVQQATDLGIPTKRIEELSTYEDEVADSWQCWWSWDNRPPELPSRLDTYRLTVYVTGDPLAKAYQDNTSPRNESEVRREFEEHTIRGLPAVARFWGEGDYGCEIIVGTGNGQGFTLTASLGPVRDIPSFCPRLIAAAELIVDAARK
jgi:hypothetical protein